MPKGKSNIISNPKHIGNELGKGNMVNNTSFSLVPDDSNFIDFCCAFLL